MNQAAVRTPCMHIGYDASLLRIRRIDIQDARFDDVKKHRASVDTTRTLHPGENM